MPAPKRSGFDQGRAGPRNTFPLWLCTKPYAMATRLMQWQLNLFLAARCLPAPQRRSERRVGAAGGAWRRHGGIGRSHQRRHLAHHQLGDKDGGAARYERIRITVPRSPQAEEGRVEPSEKPYR